METFFRVSAHMCTVQYFGYGEKCDKIFNELAWVSLNLQAFYQS
jgi:hypothetical protein